MESRDLLPTLKKHWEEINGDDEERCFFGMPVYDGWLVVDRETIRWDAEGRKETVYNWMARSPSDCLDDLSELCCDLKTGLERRFDGVLPQNIKDLAIVFDLELLIGQLCAYYFEDGNLKIETDQRCDFELHGDAEFASFFKAVCNLPHVKKFLSESPELNLLPHHSRAVYNKLKSTLKKMIWLSLGGCADKMFVTNGSDCVSEFSNHQLISMKCKDKTSLDK